MDPSTRLIPARRDSGITQDDKIGGVQPIYIYTQKRKPSALGRGFANAINCIYFGVVELVEELLVVLLFL